MSGNSNIETSIRLRIRDTESKEQDASWNDVYSLFVNKDGDVFGSLTYETDRPTFDVFHEYEAVDLVDIPDRVVTVMQKYIDNSTVNWPSSVNAQTADIEHEEAEVILKDDDNKFSFSVYSGEYVRITKNGNPIRINSVPPNIQSKVDQFIPSEAEYL
ncbi:hypothetical protein [Natronorubrum sp. FCH18a]|uniref:hypothetical protein n=1 Tax=Natronorubrum sp. FCH18a TaxID=3447018 RepID=UPI003F511C49